MEVEVIKSLIDKREYLYSVLPNKMKIFYIFDKDAEKSAVALTVNVGSAMDPPEYLGLAHFCEHMVFMGSKQYPTENAFDVFLSKNGGYTNAETSSLFTQYVFECEPKALHEGLKMFTDFFASPLFLLTAASKEIKNIESELSSRRKNEKERRAALSFQYLNKLNPLTKDSQALSEAFAGPKAGEILKEFHDKYYGANLMCAVVYSSFPFKEQQKIVEPLFSSLPMKTIDISNFGVDPPIYGEEYCGRLFQIVPTKNMRQLSFFWVYPFSQEFYDARASAYMETLINHEGESSLLTLLKKKALATHLTASADIEYKIYGSFNMLVVLTEKGEKEWLDVVEIVISYLIMIQNTPISEHLLREIETMMKLNFAFSWKDEYLCFAQDLSSALFLLPPHEIVSEGITTFSFSTKPIMEYNKLLNPLKADIFFTTKNAQGVAKKILQPWGARYSVEKFPPSLHKRLADPNPDIKKLFKLPAPNLYIPDIPLVPVKATEPVADPILLRKTKKSEIWYKADFSYEVPETIISIDIYSSDCEYGKKAKGSIFAVLYEWMVEEITQEIVHLGSEADINFSFSMSWSRPGSSIEISSYSHPKLLDFVKECLKALFSLTREKCAEVFPRVKEETLRCLSNFQHISPEAQAGRFFSCMIHSNFYLNSSLEPLVEKITPDDFYEMYAQWLEHCYYRMYSHGTIDRGTVLSLGKILDEYLGRTPFDVEDLYDYTTTKIPNQTVYDYIHLNKDQKELNSLCWVYFQHEKETDELVVILVLLATSIREKTFNMLRTEEKLGYNVQIFPETRGGIAGLAFSIESDKYCPEYILTKIDQFIILIIDFLKEMSADDFMKFKETTKLDYEKKDITLGDSADHYGTQIHRCEFNYKWKEKYIAILETITLDKVVDFATTLFLKNYKRINIEVVSRIHNEENNKLYKENRVKSKENGVKRIRIGDINDFKLMLRQYPDFQKERLVKFVKSLQ